MTISGLVLPYVSHVHLLVLLLCLSEHGALSGVTIPLKYLYLNRKPTFSASLDPHTVFVTLIFLSCSPCSALLWFLLDNTKDMDMHFVLPLLPNTFFRSSPQVPQPLFKLSPSLSFLVFFAPIKLCVKCFRRTPFLPGELFDLIPDVEHHVVIC